MVLAVEVEVATRNPGRAARGSGTALAAARLAPMLGAEEEAELARRWRRAADRAALDRLVGAHLRLAVKAAARYRNHGLGFEDLVQEGAIGLIQAARRFDPDRGVRFATYAAWWVKAAIQDHVLRNRSIVRIGTSSAHKALFFNLGRWRARHGAGEGDLTPDAALAIAVEAGTTPQAVVAIDRHLRARDQPLSAPADGTTGRPHGDLADSAPTPEDYVVAERERESRHGWLEQALAELGQRERCIVERRRLAEGDRVTLEALGARFGVSKERVRQIEARALAKLEHAARRDGIASAL